MSIKTCKRARNPVTKLLHENMQELESTSIRNSEKIPKSFWWYVGHFSGGKSPLSSVFKKGIILIEKDICKAEMFNCIFNSSFEVSGIEFDKKELKFSVGGVN